MKFAAALMLTLIPGAMAQHMLDLDEEGSKERRLGSHTSQYTNPPNSPAENGTCGDPDPNTDNTTDYMCPAGYRTKSGASTGNCSTVDACNDNCCDVNSCVCTNGVSVTNGNVHSTLCGTNGNNECASCNTGWRKVGGDCVANVCTCGNGTAASGAACTSNGAEICANCNQGYGSVGNTCEAPNVPDVNGTCADPDPNFAGTVDYQCPAGYTKNNPATPTGACDSMSACIMNCCTLNACTCTNGAGNTGTACSVNGAASCVTCNAGYTLTGSACVANVCTCENGLPLTGADCTTSAAICASCNDGYVLVQVQMQNQASKSGRCTVMPPNPAPAPGSPSPAPAASGSSGNSTNSTNTTAAPKSSTSEAGSLRASLLLTFACAVMLKAQL